MSDTDVSNCSYLTDFEDSATQAKDAQIRELTSEKETLQVVNKNLQSSLEGIKQQLRDAVSAIDSSNSIGQQIQELKCQLRDTQNEKEQLQSQLNSQTENYQNTIEQLEQQVKELSAKKNEAVSTYSNFGEQLSKLKKERNALKVDNQENAELLQAITEDYQKLKGQKKKVTQKLTAATQQLANESAANEKLSFENQKLVNERTTLLAEIDSLKLKLETASSFNDEIEKSMQSLEKELQHKCKTITTFEDQFNAQREEFSSFADERQRLLHVVTIQQKALSTAESSIEQLTKENATLKQKAKSTPKVAQKPFTTAQDFASITMPFTGELKSHCQQIMKLPQYQPFQRIQLVLNEASKVISRLSAQVLTTNTATEETKNEEIAALNSQTIFSELLDSLISELKHLVNNQELINDNPTCQADHAFIDFMNSKIEEIQDVVNREAIKDPKIIPNDFFFISDIKTRKEALTKMIEANEVTWSLFCSQFIANIFLERQLSAVTAPLQVIDGMTKTGVLKGRQLSEIPRLIEVLNQKVNITSTSNKKLQSSLKKSREQAIDLIKSDNEKKTKISELTLQIDNLQNEIDVLNVKLQVAQNEIILKQNECGNLDQFAQELRAGEERSLDQKIRTDKLEEALKQKSRECAELGKVIQELEKSVIENTNSQLRRAKKNEDLLVSQLEVLQSQVDEYEVALAERKKKMKKNEKAIREQYEKTIADLAKHYDEGKNSLEATVESLKEKSKNARDMSKTLSDGMAEVEKRNSQLQKDNNELIQRLKGIQTEITTMKNQQQKEKQQQQAQLAAQIMACETKAQQTITEEKNKLYAKINTLLQTAQTTLGSFYGTDENDFDEEAYEQTVKSAREDLDKLQYFQQEATKPKA